MEERQIPILILVDGGVLRMVLIGLQETSDKQDDLMMDRLRLELRDHKGSKDHRENKDHKDHKEIQELMGLGLFQKIKRFQEWHHSI